MLSIHFHLCRVDVNQLLSFLPFVNTLACDNRRINFTYKLIQSTTLTAISNHNTTMSNAHDLLLTIPTSTPSTSVLTSALTTSLITLAYDPYLIQRAAHLCTSNTHTVEVRLPTSSSTPLSTAASHAVESLFDHLQTQNVRVNTNEPVLLINSLGGLDGADLHEVSDAAASALRDECYHVRPVRIYAGLFTSAEEGNRGFALCFLNVVNTDIGGPGMVSLLDVADWQGRGAGRSEKWEGGGWDCVERVEWNVKDAGYEEVGKEETISETGASENGEWESEPEVELDEGVKDEHVEAKKEEEGKLEDVDAAEAAPKSVDESETVPEPFEAPDEAEFVSDLPADDPWSQRPQLRDIKHPSWEREHDKESLLDMIERQSKRLPDSKPGNAYATAASEEKANLSGEDDYEVV